MSKLATNNKELIHKITDIEIKIKNFITHNFDHIDCEELILFKEVLEVLNDIKK